MQWVKPIEKLYRKYSRHHKPHTRPRSASLLNLHWSMSIGTFLKASKQPT